MNSVEQASWFAVQSRPSQETLAEANLARLADAVFLPRVQVEQKVCGVRRRVCKALFSGYLFARFCPSRQLDAVRFAPGVVRIVCSGLEPLAIEEDVVRQIQGRVAEDGYVALESPAWRPGDRVEIQEGPLEGWFGRVERESNDAARVAILLEVLQARVVLESRALCLAGS